MMPRTRPCGRTALKDVGTERSILFTGSYVNDKIHTHLRVDNYCDRDCHPGQRGMAMAIGERDDLWRVPRPGRLRIHSEAEVDGTRGNHLAGICVCFNFGGHVELDGNSGHRRGLRSEERAAGKKDRMR